MDTARPTNVRVVPDLDDELLRAIDRLEALLASLAVWEMDTEVGLPAPFADRKALCALQAVGDVVRPTQGRGGQQLVTGRLPRRGWTGRLLPLRFVPIADAPLATLEHAMQVLTVQRAYPSLNAAVQPIRALVRRMARENPTWGYRRIQGELLGLANAARVHGASSARGRPAGRHGRGGEDAAGVEAAGAARRRPRRSWSSSPGGYPRTPPLVSGTRARERCDERAIRFVVQSTSPKRRPIAARIEHLPARGRRVHRSGQRH